MISPDDSGRLVAGNYDVIVVEHSSGFKSVLSDFLDRFEQHESEYGLDGGGYATEFKVLKEFSKTLKEDKSNLEEGELEFNMRKNRYKDIIPFSHTRVILNGNPDIAGSDYINANYIRGPSGSPRAYIACQGPLACTLNDFWRMIWECGVSVIVMACNEHESGKPKCQVYWPQQLETSLCYGNIQVTLMRSRQICSDFLIRKFSVKLLKPIDEPVEESASRPGSAANQADPAASDNINNNNNGSNIINDDNNNNNDPTDADSLSDIKLANSTGNPDSSGRKFTVLYERTICQFHYTTWPDHGAPDSVQPILDLVRLMREVQPDESRPILVHCSAGCGRTGTICCIDYVWGLLKRGKLDPSFDLYSIISDMRQQRMAMVQTLEQYILCHRAVAALFMRQLELIDKHIYENVEIVDDDDEDDDEETNFDEQDLGPVFI